MSITKAEVIRHWNYFRSLDERLNNTIQYVDHSVDIQSVASNVYDHKQKNAEVSSLEFQQIIILTSVEFEDLTKKICSNIQTEFNTKWSGIDKIYDILIGEYPGITEIEIISDYQKLRPLADMKRDKIPISNKPEKMMDHIGGICWWDAYDDLKHRSTDAFEGATLENAVLGVASLYVINLYFMQLGLNGVNLSAEKPARYFRNPYTSNLLATGGGVLPEFDVDGKENREVVDETLMLTSFKC